MMSSKAEDLETAAPSEQAPYIPEQPQRRRYLVVGGLVLLALVGLIVGLAVGLSGSNDSNSVSNAEGQGSTGGNPTDNGTPSSETASAFVYSKSFIDSVCSSETINGSGEEECTKACAPYSCCNPFLSDDSCLQDEVDSCFSYAKCNVVSAFGGDVAPAPSNLSEICSEETLEDSRSECEEKCQAAECCYANDVDTCVKDKFLICLDYAPCQNLRTNPDRLTVAPPNLDELCTPGEAEPECQEYCEKASCCLGDVLDSTDSCLESDFISCLTYSSCGGLLIPEAFGAFDPPDEDFETICSKENILGDGREECDAACEEAKCCGAFGDTIEETLDVNCFLDDPIGCVAYAPCAMLPLSGGEVDPPDPDVNLWELCSLDTLQQGGEPAIAKCAEECEGGRCCSPDAVLSGDNCLADGNLLACGEYLPCNILYIVGGDLDDPDDSLKEDCSGADAEACKEACEDASCCFALDDTNCLLGNIDTCAKWFAGGCWRNVLDGDGMFDPSLFSLP